MPTKNSLKKLIRLFKRRYKIFILLVFLLAFIFFVCNYLPNASFLKLETIVVKGPGLLVSTSDVKSVLEEKYVGASIFDLKQESISDIVSSNFPVVKNVSYKLVFPNSLVVNVDERKPFAYVKTELQKSYYILDNEGYVLGLIDNKKEDLSVIEVSNSMVFAGNKIEGNNILTTIKFLNEIKTLGLQVLSTRVNPNGTEITTLNPKIIVIISQSISGQEKEKALLLDKIFQKYNIEGKAVKRIDLRFSNPIVDF